MIEQAKTVAQRLREYRNYKAICTQAADTIDALVAEVERLQGRVETLEWENKGIAEWRDEWEKMKEQRDQLRAEVERLKQVGINGLTGAETEATASVMGLVEQEKTEYEQQNPLGGPAKVFDAMASAIRAGDDYHSTLRTYGYTEASQDHTALLRQALEALEHDGHEGGMKECLGCRAADAIKEAL